MIHDFYKMAYEATDKILDELGKSYNKNQCKDTQKIVFKALIKAYNLGKDVNVKGIGE